MGIKITWRGPKTIAERGPIFFNGSKRECLPFSTINFEKLSDRTLKEKFKYYFSQHNFDLF